MIVSHVTFRQYSRSKFEVQPQQPELLICETTEYSRSKFEVQPQLNQPGQLAESSIAVQNSRSSRNREASAINHG